MGDLAARQRALVAALVAGAAPPTGLDLARFAAAERALRAKRAAEVATAWPLLAAGLGSPPAGPDTTFVTRFAGWARGRPSNGALRDGWDFARELAAAGELPELGRAELAAREVRARYDGRGRPRPRRLPAARRVSGGWLVGAPGIGTRLLRPPFGARQCDPGCDRG